MSKIMYKDKQIMGCISDAQYVAFNNTDTGLSATNVQNAITEVNGKLDNVGKITVLCEFTSVGSAAIPDKSGYRLIAIVGYYNQQILDIKVLPTDLLGNPIFINYNDNDLMCRSKIVFISNTSVNLELLNGFNYIAICGIK